MPVRPETYITLGWQIISYIPTGYKIVDLFADGYNDSSIKSNTRLSRTGSAVEYPILIKSEKSKIPSDFTTYLKNTHKKTRIIVLVFNVIESAKGKVFNILRTIKIILSTENKCRCLTLS